MRDDLAPVLDDLQIELQRRDAKFHRRAEGQRALDGEPDPAPVRLDVELPMRARVGVPPPPNRTFRQPPAALSPLSPEISWKSI
jgi:hypothetical protein